MHYRRILLSLAACTALAACSYSKAPTLDDPVNPAAGATSVPVASSTSVVSGMPNLGEVRVTLQQVTDGVDAPVAVTFRAADPSVYVANADGRIYRIKVTTSRNGNQSFDLLNTPIVDLRSEVSHLSSANFSPDGSRLYLSYLDKENRAHLTSFALSRNSIATSDRRTLFDLATQPPVAAQGAASFGTDGFLYWNPGNTVLLPDTDIQIADAIQRVDADVPPEVPGQTYLIPDGNPFAGSSTPTVWIRGIAQASQFSFDRQTGDLWIALTDNNLQRVMRLAADTHRADAGRGLDLSEQDGASATIVEQPSADEPCGIVGGYVYRGTAIPGLVGSYVYADSCHGSLQAVQVEDGTLRDQQELNIKLERPIALGEDTAGELWVISEGGDIQSLKPEVIDG